MRSPTANLEIDGESIIRMLASDVERGANPVYGFDESIPPIVDLVFAEIIREYMNRFSVKTTGGGAPRRNNEYSDVVSKIKSSYTEYVPSRSKSKGACLALFKDRIVIGAGKYGVVYNAVDTTESRPGFRYAVKVINIYPFAHNLLYENIVNEIEIGKRMGEAGVGPRIRAVHYCEQDGGIVVMIVSDIMNSGDLSHFSRTRAITTDHVNAIEKKLRKMHSMGYVHNDIHSKNILVNRTPAGGYEFFIGDYGFSRHDTSTDKRRIDIQRVRSFLNMVTRDKLRGLLYNMVTDGRISVNVRFSQKSTQSPWEYTGDDDRGNALSP